MNSGSTTCHEGGPCLPPPCLPDVSPSAPNGAPPYVQSTTSPALAAPRTRDRESPPPNGDGLAEQEQVLSDGPSRVGSSSKSGPDCRPSESAFRPQCPKATSRSTDPARPESRDRSPGSRDAASR